MIFTEWYPMISYFSWYILPLNHCDICCLWFLYCLMTEVVSFQVIKIVDKEIEGAKARNSLLILNGSGDQHEIELPTGNSEYLVLDCHI